MEIVPADARVPASVPAGAGRALPTQGLGELIQHQLENLASVVGLEHGGSLVEADSFSLPGPSAPDQRYRVLAGTRISAGAPRRSSLSAFDSNEPRLGMIGNLLGQIVRSVTLELDGQAVSVDGFRLTNLERWAHYECPSLLDNISLETVSSSCSCDCDFCFLKGWGPLPLDRRFCTMPRGTDSKEVLLRRKKGRLARAGQRSGRALPESADSELHENGRDAQPDAVMALTTNGDFLDEPTVRELARLKPVSLVVSLNAADQEHRRRS